eukprot:GHVU01231593.1.p1 GENE.GHVU01231593.1~~GHVU01231593.1.p1  ORF type:complete len:104 (+),score=19.73 GHVU01231593.1:34-345(+)
MTVKEDSEREGEREDESTNRRGSPSTSPFIYMYVYIYSNYSIYGCNDDDDDEHGQLDSPASTHPSIHRQAIGGERRRGAVHVLDGDITIVIYDKKKQRNSFIS